LIVLQNSKNGLQRFFREKRNQAKIANQYVLKRATEVAGGFITCCCGPPYDYSIAGPQPGKFVFSDPKRVLQHNPLKTRHRKATQMRRAAADIGTAKICECVVARRCSCCCADQLVATTYAALLGARLLGLLP
jgi:hypothetical protein